MVPFGLGGGAHLASERRYQIEACLGRGGFGEVYLARTTGSSGLRRLVAVKVLRQGLDPRSEAVKRLRDEARLQAQVQHPAIVHVVDLTRIAGRVALVTEYVDGSDLTDFVGGERLPSRVAYQVAGIVADALDAAHSGPGGDGKPLDLLHRDVKPSNIRIGKRGNVKLLDFGIARGRIEDREARTQTNEVFGSVPYMAPERFAGDNAQSASDVYSLGVVLFELLTGERYYRERAIPQVLRTVFSQQLFDEFRRERFKCLPPDTPPLAYELLRRCFAFEAAQRPRAEEVAKGCEAMAAASSGPSLRSWCRARQWGETLNLGGGLVGQTVTESRFIDIPREPTEEAPPVDGPADPSSAVLDERRLTPGIPPSRYAPAPPTPLGDLDPFDAPDATAALSLIPGLGDDPFPTAYMADERDAETIRVSSAAPRPEPRTPSQSELPTLVDPHKVAATEWVKTPLLPSDSTELTQRVVPLEASGGAEETTSRVATAPPDQDEEENPVTPPGTTRPGWRSTWAVAAGLAALMVIGLVMASAFWLPGAFATADGTLPPGGGGGSTATGGDAGGGVATAQPPVPEHVIQIGTATDASDETDALSSGDSDQVETAAPLRPHARQRACVASVLEGESAPLEPDAWACARSAVGLDLFDEDPPSQIRLTDRLLANDLEVCRNSGGCLPLKETVAWSVAARESSDPLIRLSIVQRLEALPASMAVLRLREELAEAQISALSEQSGGVNDPAYVASLWAHALATARRDTLEGERLPANRSAYRMKALRSGVRLVQRAYRTGALADLPKALDHCRALASHNSVCEVGSQKSEVVTQMAIDLPLESGELVIDELAVTPGTTFYPMSAGVHLVRFRAPAGPVSRYIEVWDGGPSRLGLDGTGTAIVID